MAGAYDVSLFLLKNGSSIFTDTLSGNLKLQKLLFFADLIHLADHDKPLFTDMPITAFKNGCVVEPIRLRYKNHFKEFKNEAQESRLNLDYDEQCSLDLALDIFGDLTARELSTLSHQFECWEACYKDSIIDGLPFKELAEIPLSSLKEERFKIKPVLEAHRNNAQLGLKQIVIQGKTFFYNPHEIVLDENLVSVLEELEDEDDCLTLTLDEGRLVVY